MFRGMRGYIHRQYKLQWDIHTVKTALTFASVPIQGNGLAVVLGVLVENGVQFVVHRRTDADSREAASLPGGLTALQIFAALKGDAYVAMAHRGLMEFARR